MSIDSYSREITVTSTPTSVYKALTTEFGKWWTPSSSPVNSVGDVVTFKFEPTYWKMKATKLVPGKNVEYECVEAYHIHEGSPESILKEWEGTKLLWAIEQQGEKVIIHFTHEGLVPSLGCYGICETGWDYFFVDSLKNYLEKIEAT